MPFLGRNDFIFFRISQCYQDIHFSILWNLKRLFKRLLIEPSDPACPKAKLCGLKCQVLAGNSYVDEVIQGISNITAGLGQEFLFLGNNRDDDRRFLYKYIKFIY